jgi:hypothetical protein
MTSTVPAGAPVEERHRPFCERFDAYARPRLDLDPDTRTLTVAEYPHVDLNILLLGSSQFGGEQEHADEWAWLRAQAEHLREAMAASEAEQAQELPQRPTRSDPGLVHHCCTATSTPGCS